MQSSKIDLFFGPAWRLLRVSLCGLSLLLRGDDHAVHNRRTIIISGRRQVSADVVLAHRERDRAYIRVLYRAKEEVEGPHETKQARPQTWPKPARPWGSWLADGRR
jgi:hypothetical protein